MATCNRSTRPAKRNSRTVVAPPPTASPQNQGLIGNPVRAIFSMVPLAFALRRPEALISDQSQISATVSVATKEKLDRFTESHGLKKNYVVEQALLFFMEARRGFPDEALVPARLVLDDEAFDRLVDQLERPPPPTSALRELMRGKRR